MLGRLRAISTQTLYTTWKLAELHTCLFWLFFSVARFTNPRLYKFLHMALRLGGSLLCWQGQGSHQIVWIVRSATWFSIHEIQLARCERKIMFTNKVQLLLQNPNISLASPFHAYSLYLSTHLEQQVWLNMRDIWVCSRYVLVFNPGMRVFASGATSALSDLPRPGRTPEPSNATAQIKLSENSGVKSTKFCHA